MRTALEIANDIASLRERLRGFAYMNVHGKTAEELAEIDARQMDVERKLAALERERAAYVQYSEPPSARWVAKLL